MVRKMGLHYDRIDISKPKSKEDGVNIPVETMLNVTSGMSIILSIV